VKPVRLLIADDHSIVRRGLRALLESQPGWEVCGEAVDAREAIEKAKQLRPDVVIMDISMPGLNGLEATRRIIRSAPQIQVLVLTVHDSPEIIDRALAAGARGYVLKSDADRDLVAAVEAVRQRKSFFTPTIGEMILEGYLKRQVGRKQKGGLAGSRLTSREREIVQGLAEGRANKELAAVLGISVRTVESHRAKVMHKLGFRSFSQLVRYAIRNKIVGP
jgi:DNA-binding NarL/FixJ family response regulator